jgi:hypothetical protein
MLRFRIIAALTWCIPLPSMACSLAACSDHGIEVDRNFVIAIKHQGKPLQGVNIKVTAPDSTIKFSGVTALKGLVEVGGLQPGDYWLDASFLGINAAYFCFHVAERPSRKAKRQMRYGWGDLAPATRQIAGRLVDSQPGTGESPIWNLIHRVNIPIAGAELALQNPVTSEIYNALSDQSGSFAFDQIAAGVYVLHIDGGSGRLYDATDLLIRLSPNANRNGLELVRREPGGGSCGGTSLELISSQSPPAR